MIIEFTPREWVLFRDAVRYSLNNAKDDMPPGDRQVLKEMLKRLNDMEVIRASDERRA